MLFHPYTDGERTIDALEYIFNKKVLTFFAQSGGKPESTEYKLFINVFYISIVAVSKMLLQ